MLFVGDFSPDCLLGSLQFIQEVKDAPDQIKVSP